jgi:small subunit ribosomal protein S4
MPGVHGPNKRPSTPSSFGKQLIEKQKAKYMFGIRERQFHRYVTQATSKKGDSGIALQEILEMRLDNVAYRMGFADTRAQARQMVTHGMFALNGKPMDIPSHLVRVGDVVSVKTSKAKKKLWEGLSEKLAKRELPSWVSVDAAAKTSKVLHKPSGNDFEKVYDVKLIIEYYSTR